MTDYAPLVSVLMTAYNREVYITEAIESVLTSEYANFELIIVDDKSVDSTVSIAKEYEQADARIKVFVNEQNLGDYPNRNKAVSFARGKYIMFCDSDDKFYPDSISYCVSAMEKFSLSGIGFYYTQEKEGPFIMAKADLIKNHFFDRPILDMGPGGTIIRRDFFLNIGGYPEKYGPANDMYFNLKVCCETNILLLPKLFLYYRIHDGQEKNRRNVYIYNNYRYLDDAIANLNLGLTKKEISYLKKKNNRRFAVNLLINFVSRKSTMPTRQLWKKAGFSIRNFIIGIFHF